MPAFADDDVVVHGNAERGGDVDDGFGHLDVRLRRRRVAGGVVVHEQTQRRISRREIVIVAMSDVLRKRKTLRLLQGANCCCGTGRLQRCAHSDIATTVQRRVNRSTAIKAFVKYEPAHSRTSPFELLALMHSGRRSEG